MRVSQRVRLRDDEHDETVSPSPTAEDDRLQDEHDFNGSRSPSPVQVVSKSALHKISGMWYEAVQSFNALLLAPRELWLIYLSKFLEMYAYFSSTLILVQYLNEFGLTDLQAGWVYGIYNTLISAYGIAVGCMIDSWGVRKSLIIGSAVLLIGRFWMSLTTSKTVVYLCLYTIMPFGGSLALPVQATALRRYTNDSTRAFAFSLFYSVMNVAALFSGWSVDIIRGVKGGEENTTCFTQGSTYVAPEKLTFSTYRIIMVLGAICTLLNLFVSFAIREIHIDNEGEANAFVPIRESPFKILGTVVREKRFWRFLLLVTLLVGVRQVFRHMDATLPKYMLRTIGCDAAYGTVYSINPFMIIFLVPVVTAATLKVPLLDQILAGSWLSAFSVFFLTLPISPGLGSVLFVVFLSFGEALWSPRFYEYSTVVAPKGREGTYMALMGAPIFVTNLLVGGMSGSLLEKYCPCVKSICEPCCESLTPNCTGGASLWAIIGLATLISPVLICIFKSAILGPPSEQQNQQLEDDHSPTINQDNIELVSNREDE
jgi:MFS family permease